MEADTDEGRTFALALSRDGTNLVAGGTFKRLDGAARKYLGSVSLASGAHTVGRPSPVCAACGVVDLAAAGESVFAGLSGRWRTSRLQRQDRRPPLATTLTAMCRP